MSSLSLLSLVCICTGGGYLSGGNFRLQTSPTPYGPWSATSNILSAKSGSFLDYTLQAHLGLTQTGQGTDMYDNENTCTRRGLVLCAR